MSELFNEAGKRLKVLYTIPLVFYKEMGILMGCLVALAMFLFISAPLGLAVYLTVFKSLWWSLSIPLGIIWLVIIFVKEH